MTTDKPFLMSVEDVFSIKGRGTVVTGRVDRGTLKPMTEVEIVGLKEAIDKVMVTSMEMFHKTLDKVEAGDNAGLLLRGVNRDEVERGQVLASPRHDQAAPEVHEARCTCCARTKAGGTRPSSPATGRSSTSARWT